MGVLGGPWRSLGASWRSLGRSLGSRGVAWASLGSLWGVLWGPLGPLGLSWGLLGVPWLVLGGLGGASRGLSEAPLRSLGSLWVILKSLKNHEFLHCFHQWGGPGGALEAPCGRLVDATSPLVMSSLVSESSWDVLGRLQDISKTSRKALGTSQGRIPSRDHSDSFRVAGPRTPWGLLGGVPPRFFHGAASTHKQAQDSA